MSLATRWSCCAWIEIGADYYRFESRKEGNMKIYRYEVFTRIYSYAIPYRMIYYSVYDVFSCVNIHKGLDSVHGNSDS